MTIFSKAGLAKTVLAGVTGSLLLTALPAEARGYYGDYGRHRDRIDAGDVIAGALIIGGIAAIASAASGNRGWRGYDRSYGYNDGYASRDAVEQCVRAAQIQANRYGGWARVTDVTGIERVRDGYLVRGRVVVERRDGWNDGYGSGWDRGYGSNWDQRYDNRYGNGWDRQDRWGYRYDRYGDDYDKGRFACVTRYGRVDDVNIYGLRG